MFSNIGLPEIIVILLVLLIFFGPKYITDLARQLGEAGKELKNINSEYDEVIKTIKEPVKKEKPVKIALKKKRKKKGGDK